MLSIGRLGTTGGAEYYLDKVANNVDDYYLVGAKPRGNGSERRPKGWGWSAKSTPVACGTCWLGGRPRGRSWEPGCPKKRRPGYDLTFSAPKSASLLWAFGADEVRDAISVAHGPGCGERPRPPVHRGLLRPPRRRGQRLSEANGSFAAAFPAPHQRAGDPQLHTHVVVPKPGPGLRRPVVSPRRPSSLRLEDDRRHPLPLALRAELRPLGLSWHVRRNGLSEVRDVPQAILRAFSKRRVDIEAVMAERGSTRPERPRPRLWPPDNANQPVRHRQACCAKAGGSSWPVSSLPTPPGALVRLAWTTSPPPRPRDSDPART